MIRKGSVGIESLYPFGQLSRFLDEQVQLDYVYREGYQRLLYFSRHQH